MGEDRLEVLLEELNHLVGRAFAHSAWKSHLDFNWGLLHLAHGFAVTAPGFNQIQRSSHELGGFVKLVCNGQS